MTIQDFIGLTKKVGINAVEIRNDIEGREFADGTKAKDLKAKIDDAGLRLASINALQRFNDWTSERDNEARSLIEYTATLGAPGLVMCPVHVPGHGWSEAELERKLRESLKMLRPIFQDHGVTGYVEPLGMTHSTMKRQATAVEAVGDIDGWDAFELCYDTFQFFRCGDDRLFPEHIGLTHISGITRPDLAPEELTEPDRGFVESTDRVGNIEQLKTLIGAGYQGFISIEPFNPEVQNDPSIAAKLAASAEHVAAALGIERG